MSREIHKDEPNNVQSEITKLKQKKHEQVMASAITEDPAPKRETLKGQKQRPVLIDNNESL